MKKLIKVSSPSAVLNTFRTDAQVAFWCEVLFRQPKARDFLGNSERVKRDLSVVKICAFAEKAFALAGMALLGMKLLAVSWLPLVALLGVVLVTVQVRQVRRRVLAPYGLKLIEQEFDTESLSRTTMYQMCEALSKKYQAPSLIDIIYFSDMAKRYSVLTMDVILVIIWPVFSFMDWFLLLFAAYYVMGVVTRTEFFMRCTLKQSRGVRA